METAQSAWQIPNKIPAFFFKPETWIKSNPLNENQNTISPLTFLKRKKLREKIGK